MHSVRRSTTEFDLRLRPWKRSEQARNAVIGQGGESCALLPLKCHPRIGGEGFEFESVELLEEKCLWIASLWMRVHVCLSVLLTERLRWFKPDHHAHRAVWECIVVNQGESAY